MNRQCEICGAKVTNLNPKCTTCDPACTRAKHSGRTRNQQIKKDIKDADKRFLEELQYNPPATQ